MGNNSLSNTEKNLRSIAKRYENVKYSVGLAVLFLMNVKKANCRFLKKIFCNWLSFSVKFIWTKTYRKD